MLRATGYVRPVDDLGRVVLPISVRRELGLAPKVDVEIFVDGESVVIQKYVPGCVFCGDPNGVSEFKGKPVCTACAADLALYARI